ncbi:hypothetical protein BN14_04855 [Rhizoctonia solani AG-1 IB]|uniref:Uncharacterized protein n=1 Tax=Thanatephorus cucumeris (strain AG1-IB / isolate 7/3/14) TaxID=1108050 RepID=M5BST6_THACB|nr:hypothetical protein BN14_04855 [Rhizoctonia solani AG-1 IB]
MRFLRFWPGYETNPRRDMSTCTNPRLISSKSSTIASRTISRWDSAARRLFLVLALALPLAWDTLNNRLKLRLKLKLRLESKCSSTKRSVGT